MCTALLNYLQKSRFECNKVHKHEVNYISQAKKDIETHINSLNYQQMDKVLDDICPYKCACQDLRMNLYSKARIDVLCYQHSKARRKKNGRYVMMDLNQRNIQLDKY